MTYDKITSYSSAFNLIDNGFDIKTSLISFCEFCDDVVIAVNSSKDNTFSELYKLTKIFKNLHLIQTDISYDDPLLDGKIKNEALKFAESLGGKYFIGLDLDEELIISQKKRWMEFIEIFLDYYDYDAMLIPSVNLWGSRDTVRWDEQNNKAYKWYVHKKGFSRGPVKQGLKDDGFLNIKISDGCEILDSFGNLARSIRIDQELDNITDCQEYYKKLKEKYIYVIHSSFENFDRRLIKVNNFWKNQWQKCSNQKSIDIIDNLEDLKNFNIIKHGL